MSVIELPVRSPEEEELLHPVLAPETANSEPPDTGERRERSFAHGLNFYKLFWVFFIGCFLGVIIELIWCAVLYQKFESRAGLIYGPFNPVYGFGALVLSVGLHWLGSAAEFACSWFQEMVFGSVSWQYDGTVLNLQGRINLLHGLLWGLLGLLWVKELYPRLSRLIEKIPNKIGVAPTWTLAVLMAADIAISAMAVYRQSERREGIPARNAVAAFLDEHYPDEFLAKIYTNMVPVEKH